MNKMDKYPNNLKSTYHTASFDKNNLLLYIYNEINLKTKSFYISKNKLS